MIDHFQNVIQRKYKHISKFSEILKFSNAKLYDMCFSMGMKCDQSLRKKAWKQLTFLSTGTGM